MAYSPEILQRAKARLAEQRARCEQEQNSRREVSGGRRSHHRFVSLSGMRQ